LCMHAHEVAAPTHARGLWRTREQSWNMYLAVASFAHSCSCAMRRGGHDRFVSKPGKIRLCYIYAGCIRVTHTFLHSAASCAIFVHGSWLSWPRSCVVQPDVGQYSRCGRAFACSMLRTWFRDGPCGRLLYRNAPGPHCEVCDHADHSQCPSFGCSHATYHASSPPCYCPSHCIASHQRQQPTSHITNNATMTTMNAHLLHRHTIVD
jgi:hypothetical protein